MRLGVAREQKATAGIPVEAMDQARRPVEAEAELGEVILEAARRPRPGMDRQPGGLVDDERFAVEEQDAVLPVHPLGSATDVARPQSPATDSYGLIGNAGLI